MKQTSEKHILELVKRYPALAVCESEILTATGMMTQSFEKGGRLLVCGNGGSAADSLHIVGELMKGFILPRHPDEAFCESIRNVSPDTAEYLIANLQGALPAISLIGEVGLSTAYANDQAPDLGFAQQVMGQGRPGDVLLAISTSGNSANVIYAAQVAKAKGMKIVGLTGKGGGKMKCWCDACIAVPEIGAFKVQELHLPVYHAICLALEEEFFGGNV